MWWCASGSRYAQMKFTGPTAAVRSGMTRISASSAALDGAYVIWRVTDVKSTSAVSGFFPLTNGNTGRSSEFDPLHPVSGVPCPGIKSQSIAGAGTGK